MALSHPNARIFFYCRAMIGKKVKRRIAANESLTVRASLEAFDQFKSKKKKHHYSFGDWFLFFVVVFGHGKTECFFSLLLFSFFLLISIFYLQRFSFVCMIFRREKKNGSKSFMLFRHLKLARDTRSDTYNWIRGNAICSHQKSHSCEMKTEKCKAIFSILCIWNIKWQNVSRLLFCGET